jgi:hypothetical protein
MMLVSIDKQLISFQNCLGFLSRFCQEKGQNTFSLLKCLRGQHNTILPCYMLPASSELSGHFVGHNIV